MKIDKKRILEIINEEFDMLQKQEMPQNHMNHSDAEGKMAQNQLQHIARYAMEMHQMLEPYGENMQLESWVQSKITLANDYMSKVKHYLENELNMSNDVDQKE